MVEAARIVTAALQIDSSYSQVGVSVHVNVIQIPWASVRFTKSITIGSTVSAGYAALTTSTQTCRPRNQGLF